MGKHTFLAGCMLLLFSVKESYGFYSFGNFVTSSSDTTQYFTSFDSTQIAYTDEGNGFPVLLIHGFISNRTSWNDTELKKDLLLKGYRVINPDLRGNGESGRPHNGEAYANNAEVKDLVLLLSHLKLKKYYAVGYSRGAIVLAKLLTMDNRIKKSVMGGMGADFTNPNWSRRIMFAAAFNGKAHLYPETAGAVQYAKSIGADTLVLYYLQKHQPLTTAKELKKINTPVLVIAGDKDTDNGTPASLQALLKKGELKIVSGTHNETHKTKDFSNAVITFLQDL
jgi:pimeloyl-ACP methyl ester carboxylesterase